MQPKRYANALISLVLISGAMLTERGSAQAQIFVPPPGQDMPRNGTGGASRSGDMCAQPSEIEVSNGTSMTALLPESQYGATLSPTPIILVYLPELAEGEAFFSLKKKNGSL